MRLARQHSWDLSLAEAAALQRRLAGEVAERPLGGRVGIVAGTDVSYSPGEEALFAAVVLLAFPSLEPVGQATVRGVPRFPYVPGFLSFRELPPLLDCFRRLELVPDVVLCDGQGRAHPRRFGLACHLGWWLDVPVIGCAKSRLTGTAAPPGPRRGASTRLLDARTGELLGRVVRTRSGVSPVFVSTGHAITLPEAVRLTLRCARATRLPEPTRQAHMLSKAARSAPPRAPLC